MESIWVIADNGLTGAGGDRIVPGVTSGDVTNAAVAAMPPESKRFQGGIPCD